MFAYATATLLLSVFGCSSTGDTGAAGPIRVVATVPLIGEFATAVAGPDARVTTLVPLGVDEHAFQPSTTVARAVAEADLALVNGYLLEAGLLSIVVQNVRRDVPVIAVARDLEPLSDGHAADAAEAGAAQAGARRVDAQVFADGDPHFWLDARNAVRYVEAIRDALAATDPAHGEGYRTRAAALIAELEALDAELRETLAVIPADRRKIVVFHDAFEYLARAYDFAVIASVAPANANQAASAATVAQIVETVRAQGVATIYREPQYSGQTLELIAEESGTRVAVLYSIPTADVPTYVAMMRANARALVEGLAP